MHCYNCNIIKLFYMFRAMKVHHHEVSYRIQAVWYNVMSKHRWYYGPGSVVVIATAYGLDGPGIKSR